MFCSFQLFFVVTVFLSLFLVEQACDIAINTGPLYNVFLLTFYNTKLTLNAFPLPVLSRSDYLFWSLSSHNYFQNGFYLLIATISCVCCYLHFMLLLIIHILYKYILENVCRWSSCEA